MTTLLTSATGGPPVTAEDLIAAARCLGQAVVTESLSSPGGSAGERLALSAVVLGAAERQVLDAERELAGPGRRAALGDAARVTAEVVCGDQAGRTRVWLAWRAGHLLNQLDILRRDDRDAAAVRAAASAVHAAAVILQAQAHAMSRGQDPGDLAPDTVAAVRGALTDAVRTLGQVPLQEG